MGNVSSRQDDASPVLIRDQNRLSVSSLKITTSNGRLLYTILPNTFPATRYTVRKGDDEDGIIEYVQDPEAIAPGTPPNFLLRLNCDNDILFYFTFAMRQSTAPVPQGDGASATAAAIDTIINSLTFVFAPTRKELDTLVTREFNANPNLHKNPNVDLVGDYSTSGSAQEQFEWCWKWRPPKMTTDKGNGWRNSCSFVEYDQRAHRLSTLMTFSFWVNSTRGRPGSPKSPMDSRGTFLVPPRARLPSSKSIESRLSDSDTDRDIAERRDPERRDPVSPFETIPETANSSNPTPPSNPSNAVKVDLNTATGNGDFSNADDGPLFRATIKSLESKTGSVRQRMKKVIKKAEAAKESQSDSNACFAAFTDALREAANSNANAVQPAIDHYFEKIAKEILSYEKQNADNLQRLIIDPLSRIYGNDIKQADAKKKDFEDESRDYYAYVSRYLGQRQDSLKEKKRAESDTKYESKRKTFELKRFDYSSFMQDLHGGRKDQEVLSQLTKFADAQAKSYLAAAKRVEAMLPQLDALSFEVKEADKQYQLIRTGREEKRRALVKSNKGITEEGPSSIPTSYPNSSAVNPRQSTQLTESDPFSSTGAAITALPTRPTSGVPLGAAGLAQKPGLAEPNVTSSPGAHSIATTASPGPDRFKGIRDLETSTDERNSEHRKEGLLWSMSKPGSHADPRGLNKQAWHKYWIVLDQGTMQEYINWKTVPEAHNSIIDLRMASVREARGADRRFCFEVITPHFNRVYQATGEDDLRSWMQAINNALQTAYEGKTPPVEPAQVGGQRNSIAQALFGKSSSLHGHRQASSNYLNSKNVSRHFTVGDRPPLSRSRSSEERPARLLHSIRNADAGNAWCADCNSDVRVEWVSINLGIIICIECSGIHRSLGTHISKIRSLTLDTNAFTQDIVELILSLGNRVSNMIWEAKLDRSQKPGPSASREQRLAFITSKYQQRAYVEPISASFSHYSSAEETLLASIKKSELQNVYYALALAANPNATDRSRSTHAVYLALAAADPATPGTPTQPSTPISSTTDLTQARKAFPVAELLLQNGSEIPTQAAPIPLSRSALLYLEFKRAQKMGRLGGGGGTAGANGTSGPGPPPSSFKDFDSHKRDKLSKRSSATPKGGRGPGA